MTARLSAEDKRQLDAMAEARPLLESVGLRLRAYDPGVSAYDSEQYVLNFDRREWAVVKQLITQRNALHVAVLVAVERCLSCGHERQWHGERECSMCAGRDTLDLCREFRVDEALQALVT